MSRVVALPSGTMMWDVVCGAIPVAVPLTSMYSQSAMLFWISITPQVRDVGSDGWAGCGGDAIGSSVSEWPTS